MTQLTLPDVVVGVSISDSPDLVTLGLGEIHVRHALIELVRHVLAAGGTVAYGGDFRPGGYTDALLDLIRAYERGDQPGPEHFRTYLAWPLGQSLPASDRAALRPLTTIVTIPSPAERRQTLTDSGRHSRSPRCASR